MATFLMIVQILGGLLTPVIAVVAIWIAYQQWRTATGQHKVAQDKLKLDLFDRRYKVYQGLVDFIAVLNNTGRPDQETFGAFYQAIGPAQFLFGNDVWEYMMEVRKQAVELRHVGHTIKRATDDKCETISQEELTRASETERRLLTWFYHQPEIAVQKFLPAIGFKNAL